MDEVVYASSFRWRILEDIALSELYIGRATSQVQELASDPHHSRAAVWLDVRVRRRVPRAPYLRTCGYVGNLRIRWELHGGVDCEL